MLCLPPLRASAGFHMLNEFGVVFEGLLKGLSLCSSGCFQVSDVPPHANQEQSLTQKKKCGCGSHFVTTQGPGFLPLKAEHRKVPSQQLREIAAQISHNVHATLE